MTKPTKRARKKDLTGVNLAAIHKRLRALEEQMVGLLALLKFSTECFGERISLKGRDSKVKK